MHPTVVLLLKKPFQPTSDIYPLRFKELLPLKLKNEVSFKGDRASDSQQTCLQPMTEMFECFKKNEFSQTMCAKEILAFKQCSETSRIQSGEQKKIRREGTLPPDVDRVTARQANVLLKKYPQHNPNVPDRWPR